MGNLPMEYPGSLGEDAMDEEEIRILKLARIGREKIFKYGTYEVQSVKNVYIPNHPFYVVPEEVTNTQDVSDDMYASEMGYEDSYMSSEMEPMAPPPPPAISEAELMTQIMSSNFKTGLSQEEVDALLGTMTF